MNTNPAIAGSILSKFGMIVATALGAVYATDRIIKVANRKELSENGREQLKVYNASVQMKQDPLDTILDRTHLMEMAKAKKPWNMTLAEKERTRHH
ncbi:hypothetical protein LSUE1_G004607 [Lachnellula suecica]|uniref:Uncharacterized protein n=1 Tax=Lachnellula suecica TaxID=602035 RepID=A0A8T9CDX5_9HELO|nr:hypothetical protein LSUE1_G004607 [Lachnellula suecica]